MKLTKEKALELGFHVIYEKNSSLDKEIISFKNIGIYFFMVLDFEAENVKLNFHLLEREIPESYILMVFNDFTEERIKAIFKAFSSEPIQEEAKPSKFGVPPLFAFVGGLVAGWESSKYESKKVCTSCCNESTGKCCSNPQPIDLQEYLTECKKFSLKYAQLKREYNSLIQKMKEL